jgi:choline dehydrogenase-like flavoprotein
VSPALAAAVDRVLPSIDGVRAGWEGGVAQYLESAGADLDWAGGPLDRLEQRLGDGFASLTTAAQDAALLALSDDPAAADEVAALVRVSFEGYYAARPGVRPAGLDVVDFHPVPEGVTPIEPEPLRSIRSADVRSSYDAVVIGSGPGGGVAAALLAEAGKHVLLVERAPAKPNAALRGDHLHGKRNAVYDSVAGPGPGHPRELRLADGGRRTIDGTGDAWLYGLNAMTLGGGTRLWQGMAWRFMPEDFRMRTVHGEPEGASLPDWPIDYEDLEPYYSRAEQELGVAGEEGGLTGRTPRSAGYPMPAMGTEPARELLGRAADSLGWGWGPIPLAINSVPHAGRAACVRCPQCVGHACPVDAKNGSHNTFVPRALATGRCDLLQDAEVVEVRDGTDRASVTIMADASGAPVELTVDAEVVVVAAGAVETPRLLLASGIGNGTMGRYLHDHRFVTVLGRTDSPVKPYVGPGHSVATLDHAHADTIPWGGGVLVDLMSLLPLTSALNPEPGVPAWGAEHTRWMRDGRRFGFGVFGMGQEVPHADSGVTLSSSVRDRWGRPVASLAKRVHPASTEIEQGMAVQGARWLEAAGARNVHRQVGAPTASAAGEHSCGTARMGSDPASSATDPFGRPWGTRRIVVCDSSLHPTNGSVNPTLTIVANALRVAEHLVAAWPATAAGRTA